MPAWKETPLVRGLIYDGARSANAVLDVLGLRRRVPVKETDRLATLSADRGRAYGKAQPNGRRVLFFPMRTAPPPNVVEATLMHALGLRGAEVKAILSGRALPACDCRTVLNDRPSFCADCHRWATQYFRNFRLPIAYLTEYVTPAEIAEAAEFAARFGLDDFVGATYDGYPVGEIAHPSVLRHLLRGTLPRDARTESIARRYLAAAVIGVVAAGRIFDDFRPDTIVISHGYYVTYGPYCHVAKRRGIPVFVHEPGYRLNSIVVSLGGHYWDVLGPEPRPVWANSIRDARQREEIRDYLLSRREGKKDIIQYNPGAIEDQGVLRRELGLAPSGGPVFAMFTNLCWDGAVMGRNIAFRDMIEWVVETVRFFARHPDRRLVIRAHPAETILKKVETQEKVADILARDVGALPPNVILIAPESKISSYALAEMADYGIVYTSKAGLEFAVMGLPVIVAGDAFYMGKGFTHDAPTKEAYFALLADPPVPSRLSEARREAALDYARYYFFRRLLPFPLYDPATHAPTYPNLAALAPGKVPELDLICEAILAGRDVVLP